MDASPTAMITAQAPEWSMGSGFLTSITCTCTVSLPPGLASFKDVGETWGYIGEGERDKSVVFVTCRTREEVARDEEGSVPRRHAEETASRVAMILDPSHCRMVFDHISTYLSGTSSSMTTPLSSTMNRLGSAARTW